MIWYSSSARLTKSARLFSSRLHFLRKSENSLNNISKTHLLFPSFPARLQKLHEVLKLDGSDKVLIFRERKHHVDELEKDLRRAGFMAGAIHGDKRSRERIRILDSFKQDKINILIAT